MSELWICREQTARVPFRLKLPDIEIRTIEELCYYLYHSMEYMDEALMEEPLFTWLDQELMLPKLAESLAQQRKQGRSAFWCAWFLLTEVGMYTEEELSQFKILCLSMENRDEFERHKLRADRLLVNGKYESCIREYRCLLQRDEAEEHGSRLLGDIWHNLGVAYARLFLFPEAAEYFEKAYGLNQRDQSCMAWQEAAALAETKGQQKQLFPEDWSAVSENMESQGSRSAMSEQNGNPQVDVDWAAELSRLKDDYRKKVM